MAPCCQSFFAIADSHRLVIYRTYARKLSIYVIALQKMIPLAGLITVVYLPENCRKH
ncbi:hypothetical protein [Scytonema sp. PCC 10023]|uniref:hypothetical protein n=1 Tax=Scytonema sp. PCC 10023 TaxID=1680591 RepID=UPI0039C650BD